MGERICKVLRVLETGEKGLKVKPFLEKGNGLKVEPNPVPTVAMAVLLLVSASMFAVLGLGETDEGGGK